MTIRAAIYIRVSTKSQKDDGTSLTTQEDACRKYCEAEDFDVVEALVISEDHTGTDLNRPGIVELRDAATAGRFDRLVTPSFDRFHRPKNDGDEWQSLELIAFFKENGVTVEFVDGSIPTSGSFGSIISVLESWKAGAYRRQMLERHPLGVLDDQLVEPGAQFRCRGVEQARKRPQIAAPPQRMEMFGRLLLAARAASIVLSLAGQQDLRMLFASRRAPSGGRENLPS